MFLMLTVICWYKPNNNIQYDTDINCSAFNGMEEISFWKNIYLYHQNQTKLFDDLYKTQKEYINCIENLVNCDIEVQKSSKEIVDLMKILLESNQNLEKLKESRYECGMNLKSAIQEKSKKQCQIF